MPLYIKALHDYAPERTEVKQAVLKPCGLGFCECAGRDAALGKEFFLARSARPAYSFRSELGRAR